MKKTKFKKWKLNKCMKRNKYHNMSLGKINGINLAKGEISNIYKE